MLPYITAGYPDMASTGDLLRACDRQGVTAVELGIPYGDSIADGPVIQTSFTRVLAKGFRVADVFEMMGQVRGRFRFPFWRWFRFRSCIEWVSSHSSRMPSKPDSMD